MRTVYEREIAAARKIERSLVQGTAPLCRPAFGIVCKALWPHKTAEALAAATGIGVRAASYQISGEHDPTARSVQAIVNAIIPPRA